MPTSAALFGYLPLILVFVVFYLIVLRPQAKQAQAHREMMGDLGKGDTVVTLGGLRGEIIKLNDETVTFQTGDSELIIEKHAISSRISKAPESKSRVSKKKPKN